MDRVWIEDIIKITAEITGCTVEDICGQRRYAHLTIVRAAVTVVARDLNRTQEAIGAALNKDHSTIHYYLEQWSRKPLTRAVAAAVRDVLEGEPVLPVRVPRSQQFRRKQAAARAVRRSGVVAPFPPGAEQLLLRGFSLKTVHRLHGSKEWR